MTLRTLAGRRVLELGSYLAAPFAGHMLAHLGADVVKVEPPAGDPMRTIVRGGPGGTFIAYSTGKRSACIDLHSAEGHAVFDRLLGTADVVLHNLAPDSTRRLRVTYDDCHRVQPDIVYCHIKGYGQGPLENNLASNPVVEASIGVMFGNRVNGRPTRLGPSFYDMFAGNYAVIGILSALASRGDDKEARRIEIGLYETGLYVAGRDLVGSQLNQQFPQQAGFNPAEFGFPGYGSYETADRRWIFVVMMNDEHWRKFCHVMSLSEGKDPSLATTSQRQERFEQVEDLVSMAIRGLSFDTIAARLRSARLGHTEVMPPSKVLEEPQAKHPGKIACVAYEGHEYKIPNFPVTTASGAAGPQTPPPVLGQHTIEILSGLGYELSHCRALLESGVIRAPA